MGDEMIRVKRGNAANEWTASYVYSPVKHSAPPDTPGVYPVVQPEAHRKFTVTEGASGEPVSVTEQAPNQSPSTLQKITLPNPGYKAFTPENDRDELLQKMMTEEVDKQSGMKVIPPEKGSDTYVITENDGGQQHEVNIWDDPAHHDLTYLDMNGDGAADRVFEHQAGQNGEHATYTEVFDFPDHHGWWDSVQEVVGAARDIAKDQM